MSDYSSNRADSTAPSAEASQSWLPMNERSQRWLIILLSGIQFVNVVDFMMIMPLGPDLSDKLGIPLSKMGLLGGGYAAAAGISGIVSSRFVDRFDRKKALCFALACLGLATLATAFATTLSGLLSARILAGIFGGPATGLAMAIIADRFNPRERGRVIGKFMTAFSLASIAGVPLGLELARLGSWKTPFFVLAFCSFLMVLFGLKALPNLRNHLDTAAYPSNAPALPKWRQNVIFSHMSLGLAMASAFFLIPNIATFIQENLGFPREHLGRLYLFGGIASYIAARSGGHLVDRFGSLPVAWAATCVVVVVMIFGFAYPSAYLSPHLIFILFMVGMALRNVAQQTLASKVPAPKERAGFMSFQSAVQHFCCAAGAYFSSLILYDNSEGGLGGMTENALIAAGIFFLVPITMGYIKLTRVKINDKNCVQEINQHAA